MSDCHGLRRQRLAGLHINQANGCGSSAALYRHRVFDRDHGAAYRNRYVTANAYCCAFVHLGPNIGPHAGADRHGHRLS